jgi:hypothetical protein
MGKSLEIRLFEIRRPPFQTLAFLTFGHILDLTLFKEGLHLNLPAAGTKEFLSGAGCTRILTLSHRSISPPLYGVFARLLR